MSEKSDLRERAREKSREVAKKWATDWLAENRIWQARGYDFGNHVATIITNLLAALDTAEREERERCEKAVEEQIKHVSRYMFYIDGRAATVLRERILAAIRREGGKG